MKYMGSKTALLDGDLGRILLEESASATRFVDLFAGSGAVSHHVAESTSLPVLSVDLQEYARILTGCITERTADLSNDDGLASWLSKVEQVLEAEPGDANDLSVPITAESVAADRLVASDSDAGFISRHYGGHYYSVRQALVFDHLCAALPTDISRRTIALAAILHAASVCAAAPGHTAQPFQPTESLLPYITQAWRRDVLTEVKKALRSLTPRHAKVKGEAVTESAETAVERLNEGDLVFCDPPYSAAQYSRFYHVLEGIARGGWDHVSGQGRAPERAKRETSAFSMKSKAPTAMKELLEALRIKECRIIITFPDTDASNGLSGADIIKLAEDAWTIEPHYVDSVHSTLGGANGDKGRGGRRKLKEAVLLLAPKPRSVSLVAEVPVSVESIPTASVPLAQGQATPEPISA